MPAASTTAISLIGVVRHDRAAHRVGIDVGAAAQPVCPIAVERRDRLADPPFGARDGALRREANLFGRLALDVASRPRRISATGTPAANAPTTTATYARSLRDTETS